MTTNEEKLTALEAVLGSFADDFKTAVNGQAKLGAVNTALLFDMPQTLASFVNMTQGSYFACLAWAIQEGYVTLTDKALKSEEEQHVDVTQQSASLTVDMLDHVSRGAYL